MVHGTSYPLLESQIFFQDPNIQYKFKSNLTSAISNISKLQHLASYVSHHKAMAYDRPYWTRPPSPGL